MKDTEERVELPALYTSEGWVRKGFVKGLSVSPERLAAFWYKVRKALSGERGQGTAAPKIHGSLRHRWDLGGARGGSVPLGESHTQNRLAICFLGEYLSSSCFGMMKLKN